MVITDTEPGGGRSDSVGKFLKSGGTGGVDVWGGDVGAHPKDGAGPGYLPSQGRAKYHRETTEETGIWESGLPAIGGGNVRIRLRGDQEIHHKEAEHSCKVYYDAINS